MDRDTRRLLKSKLDAATRAKRANLILLDGFVFQEGETPRLQRRTWTDAALRSSIATLRKEAGVRHLRRREYDRRRAAATYEGRQFPTSDLIRRRLGGWPGRPR